MKKHLHILGIGGTFMASLALLARELGYEVTGSDLPLYPPMSTMLERAGIPVHVGYGIEPLRTRPDAIVIGNALSRGNPAVEFVLNQNWPYTSGAEWLAQKVLQNRHVIAVAGTHGKTTTTSMIAWILEQAGLHPGFLIGGQPVNFEFSARLGTGPYFVVEADEYDTAFFDKRSKFLHYRPKTLVINNIEFDHADIFENLAAIQLQFRYLLRTVPSEGLLVCAAEDDNVAEVLKHATWTPVDTFGLHRGHWHAHGLNEEGSHFQLLHHENIVGEVHWPLLGLHNIHNALAAAATCHSLGIEVASICNSLCTFSGVKRRLEEYAVINGIHLYDDFAHHPTAIACGVAALRKRIGTERLWVVLQLGSNTMKRGHHNATLLQSLAGADRIIILEPAGNSLAAAFDSVGAKVTLLPSVGKIVQLLCEQLQPQDHVVMMSNRGFDGLAPKLMEALHQKNATAPAHPLA